MQIYYKDIISNAYLAVLNLTRDKTSSFILKYHIE